MFQVGNYSVEAPVFEKIYLVHLYDNEYMNVTPFVSAHTQAVMLRSSRDPGTLNPKLTSAMLRDHYVREIKLMKVGSVNRAH